MDAFLHCKSLFACAAAYGDVSGVVETDAEGVDESRCVETGEIMR